MKSDRYTIVEHKSIFSTAVHKWYSLYDHKDGLDVDLDNKTWEYAREVCQKFNKEDRQGLHP